MIGSEACIPAGVNSGVFFDFKEGTGSVPTLGNAYGSSQDILEPVTPEQINTVNWLYPPHITASGIELHLLLRKNKNIYCCL